MLPFHFLSSDSPSRSQRPLSSTWMRSPRISCSGAHQYRQQMCSTPWRGLCSLSSVCSSLCRTRCTSSHQGSGSWTPKGHRGRLWSPSLSLPAASLISQEPLGIASIDRWPALLLSDAFSHRNLLLRKQLPVESQPFFGSLWGPQAVLSLGLQKNVVFSNSLIPQ